jgi:GT2 family glycosyltransferase
MFGEEHTFALRAWTNDYRIFTVKETVVFHLGKNSEYRQTLGVGDFANQYDKIDHSRSNEAQRKAF